MHHGLVCLVSLLVTFVQAPGQNGPPVRLREAFPTGYRYHVSSRAEVNGTLQPPAEAGKDAKPIPVSGSTTVEYDERVLGGDERGPVEKTIRVYRRMDLRRKVGVQSQEGGLRPEVRRLVMLRVDRAVVPFSPDGPLSQAEVDLARVEVFTPGLQGLLPAAEVRVGDTWPATPAAALHLTDLETLTTGQVTCKLQELATRDGRRFARVGLSGTLSGATSDGPNRQNVDGYFFFDLESNHLSYLYLNGTSFLLGPDGKEVGRLEGRYTLTRQLGGTPDLDDVALRGVKTDPTPETTALLFHEPAMGVKFVHARRWTARGDARQILLDEPGGGGVAITLEPPTQVPSGAQFLAEAKTALGKQGAKLGRVEGPTTLAPGLEHFTVEAELMKEHLLLDYYVVRQAAGGATFAGRYPAGKDAAELGREVERIARSLQLVPPPKK